ncbi:glutaredoxin family protein [Mycobacterium malmoense]|uniref:glutaredoxin family protein n=1 Tax=Mycobacterium malmoense TaxID=1780 RepID=UPI0008F95E65|nr:glutaredoxin family protein [Mycobacterium malmoense]OIN79993.1 NrdH-redoxin [Mycobacterium malmoense]
MTTTVTVYTAGPACMACTQTKRHLERRGIPYTEIPINENIASAGIRAAIAELGFSTAPVVCVSTHSGEQAWDGYRPDRIDALTQPHK